MDKELEQQLKSMDERLAMIEKCIWNEDRKAWQVPYFQFMKQWTALKSLLKQLDKERTEGHGHD